MKNKFNRSLVSGGVVISIILGTTFMSFGAGIDNFTTKNAYSQSVFKDIKEKDWFYKDVAKAYELGLVSGKGNNEFNPSGKVTIAEAIMIATNINSQYAGEEVVSSEGDKWYSAAVDYAENNSIIKKNEWVNYDNFATRAEVAYILSNSLPKEELNDINNIEKLPDVNSSNKYSENIFKLYNSGIIRGSGENGEFKPNSQISRAEIAALVNRLVKPENRQEFKLGPIIYKNDKIGFTMDIPRIWEGKYEITEVESKGEHSMHFRLIKNGELMSDLFLIETTNAEKYDNNPDRDLFDTYVGRNRGKVILSDRAHDFTKYEILEAENKDALDMYVKMMDEDYKKILDSIKYY